MPKSARLLNFPARNRTEVLNRDAIAAAAGDFLSSEVDERDFDSLSNTDVLLSVVSRLWDTANVEPSRVSADAVAIYRWIEDSSRRIGVFDEHDYFWGEAALIAAGTFRVLGDFDVAETWLERADAAYQHTVNPSPLVAKVQYQRLALKYARRRYASVIEFAPALKTSFERLGMAGEATKTCFLQGMALKESGDLQAAFQLFEGLRSNSIDNAGGILAAALIEIGAYHGLNTRYESAVEAYEEAFSHISVSNDPIQMAHLKATIAETYRAKGELHVAVDSYRLAIQQYAEAGLTAMVAYLRVVTAETLIAAKREPEAYWELIAALPVIESQEMVPEGLAAVALLKECVERRAVDGEMLKRVLGHLSTN